MGLKLSMVVECGPTRLKSFSKQPKKGRRTLRGQITLGMPYGHQIWLEEPLTEVWCIAGVKGNVGVMQGQPGVKLLWNAI